MWSIGEIERVNKESANKRLHSEIDKLKGFLFDLCSLLEKNSQMPLLVTVKDGKLIKWLIEERKIKARKKAKKEEEAKRLLAQEEAKRKRKKEREQILKKLTPEEIKILRY